MLFNILKLKINSFSDFGDSGSFPSPSVRFFFSDNSFSVCVRHSSHEKKEDLVFHHQTTNESSQDRAPPDRSLQASLVTSFRETSPGHPPHLLARRPSFGSSCSNNQWFSPGKWPEFRQHFGSVHLSGSATQPAHTSGPNDWQPHHLRRHHENLACHGREILRTSRTQQTEILVGMLAELRPPSPTCPAYSSSSKPGGATSGSQF